MLQTQKRNWRFWLVLGLILAGLLVLFAQRVTQLALPGLGISPKTAVFVKTLPVYAPHHVVGQFKGYTAFTLRNEFPHLKSRLLGLWIRSDYIESIDHVSEGAIRQYIEDQKYK